MSMRDMCVDCEQADEELDGTGRCGACANLASVEAERDALREALGSIIELADKASEDGCGFVDAVADIEEAARAALAGKGAAP